MIKELNASQIKRINTVIKPSGFRGRVNESGVDIEFFPYAKKGCNVNIYFSSRFTDYMKLYFNHSGTGGDDLSKGEASIKNLQKGVKLAKKIDNIING